MGARTHLENIQLARAASLRAPMIRPRDVPPRLLRSGSSRPDNPHLVANGTITVAIILLPDPEPTAWRRWSLDSNAPRASTSSSAGPPTPPATATAPSTLELQSHGRDVVQRIPVVVR